MNTQSDAHISSLVEELDFEEEADVSNGEEEFDVTEGSRIDAYALEGIQQTESKLEHMGDLNDLEDGEVSDNHLCKKETNILFTKDVVFDVSDVIPVKINEELNDLEEGEISESDSTKKNERSICRYFKFGSCAFGSHCNFLHISENVYNMFNPATYKQNVKVPCSILPEIENPVHLEQSNKTAWEKGLENAKANIQKAISKRIDDKEFENKKLYISSNSAKLQDRDLSFETNAKSVLNVSPSIEPFNENTLSFVPNKTIKQKQSSYSSCFKDKKPINSHEYKWVDPWLRSKSRNKKRCRSRSSSRRSKRAFSSSSSSEIERIYRGSDVTKKFKKTSTSQHNNKPNYRSYSRSFSKSPSWSRSRKRHRSRSLSWSRSPCKKRVIRRRKRSTSLEKWFKSQHRIGSRSSSRSSVCCRASRSISPKRNSDNESWSSVTVSSITCSHTSSDSSTSQRKQSKSNVENELLNTKSFKNSQNATQTHHLQRNKPPLQDNCVKDKLISSHSNISVSKEKKSVSCSYKNTTEKPNTCVTGNTSNTTRHTISQKITPKPVSVSSSKPSQIRAVSKVSSSQSIGDAPHHGAYSKSKSPVINSVPSSKGLDTTSTLKVPDSKRTFSLSKKTIALNLQPKTPRHQNPSEVLYKKDLPGTICKLLMEKSTLSRKETLLKQLKLVEDAISKKKKCL